MRSLFLCHTHKQRLQPQLHNLIHVNPYSILIEPIHLQIFSNGAFSTVPHPRYEEISSYGSPRTAMPTDARRLYQYWTAPLRPALWTPNPP